MVVLLAVILPLVLLLAAGAWAVAAYNGFVRSRNAVQEAWRQIDVELTRRHDLIPNLVESVKGYAAHERGTLDDVIRARQAAMTPATGPQEQAAHEGVLSAALGRLFALAEAYPTLQANQNFLALQKALGETEDRIAAGRRYYNANVRVLNTKVESFPSNVIAGMFHVERAEYFEAEDAAVRAVPQVSFGGSVDSAGTPPIGTGSPGAIGGGAAGAGQWVERPDAGPQDPAS